VNRLTEAPSGFAFEGRAAGRERVSTGGGFPQRRGYHEAGRAGRGVKVYVETAFGPKVAGVLVTEGGRTVFRRLVQRGPHLVRVPEESWSFDAAVLAKAQAAGAAEVQVIDEVGCKWWTSLSYLMERGEPLDRGHGKQVALPLRFWSFLPADSAARQLRLLEVGNA